MKKFNVHFTILKTNERFKYTVIAETPEEANKALRKNFDEHKLHIRKTKLVK